MGRYFGAAPAQAPSAPGIPVISEESKSGVDGELQAKEFSGAESVNAAVTSGVPILETATQNPTATTQESKPNLTSAPSPAPAAAAAVNSLGADANNDNNFNTTNPATIARLPPIGELFTLKFKQDSWIQVKTESGLVLSSHLARAGTQESFSVKQALQVKIGNAAGVDASLRGAALPISPEKGSNVANLSVK